MDGHVRQDDTAVDLVPLLLSGRDLRGTVVYCAAVVVQDGPSARTKPAAESQGLDRGCYEAAQHDDGQE